MLRLLHDLRLIFEASVITAAFLFSIWLVHEGTPIAIEWARGKIEFVPVWTFVYREWEAYKKKKGSDSRPTPEERQSLAGEDCGGVGGPALTASDGHANPVRERDRGAA